MEAKKGAAENHQGVTADKEQEVTADKHLEVTEGRHQVRVAPAQNQGETDRHQHVKLRHQNRRQNLPLKKAVPVGVVLQKRAIPQAIRRLNLLRKVKAGVI